MNRARQNRRRRIVGSNGDVFGGGGSRVPGGSGQFTLLEHPFTSVGDPRSTDRLGWPVDTIAPSCAYDWADGDGPNPLIGPVMLTAGTPTAGVETGWQLSDGTAVTCTRFDNNENYRTLTLVDPAAGEDMVILVLVRIIPSAGSRILSTRNADPGWFIFQNAAGTIAFRSADAGAFVASGPVTVFSGWALIGVTFDLGALQSLYVNGNLIDSDSVAALGNIFPGDGLGLNATPSGFVDVPTDYARAMIFYGAGIADIADAPWHARLAHRVIGIEPIQGDRGVFDRTAMSSWQNRNGVWALASNTMPRAGDSGGFRAAPARTNQAFRNIDPQAGDAAAALTWTGAAAPTEVDDSAALEAVANDASEWGDNTFEYVNNTGAVQYVQMSQQTGNTNPHSLQLLGRRTAGAGAVDLGLYDVSAGTFVVGAALIDGYNTRTLVHGQVPADIDCVMCLRVDDTVGIRWIAHDMTEAPRCTTPVPNYSTVAAAVAPFDDFVSSETPVNDQGSVELVATPLGWSGAEAGALSVLFQTGGGAPNLHVTGGTWQADIDGTTTLDSGVAPADGVPARIRLRWATDGLMSIDVDGTRVEAAYDGALLAAGAWQIVTGAEVSITSFRVFRNGDG